MKTTVDILDVIFHRAKVIAAYLKTTLKTMIVAEASGDANQFLIDVLVAGRNKTSVGRLKRDELYERGLLRRH